MDKHGASAQSCPVQFTQFGAVPAFAGEVTTVRCYHDNALIRRRLSERGDGRVLVVDGGASLNCALVGDVVAGIALRNGWSGLVIWGAVRDVAGLRRIPLGIKALGSNPRPPSTDGAGEIDVEVVFGDVVFRPGALVYCDDDGIVVLADPLAPAV